MEFRTIDYERDRPAIIEHIRAVHGEQDAELLDQWYGTMPGFDPQNCFVIASEDGAIISHLMLFPRYLQIGSSLLKASEIGVVGTLEAYRDQGYASTLIEHALAHAAARGDVVSILFGIPNFYEQWEFEYGVGVYLTSYESSIQTSLALQAAKWDLNNAFHRRMEIQLGVQNKPIVVRAFNSGDLPSVMELYRRESLKGHYLIARDEETWLWQLDFLAQTGRGDLSNFLVAELNNAILGYIRLSTQEPINWQSAYSSNVSIFEFASEDADATEALLLEAAACARIFDADQIGLYVHPQSRLMRHALVHGAIQREFTGAGFIRLNDLGRALEAMRPTLQSRLDGTLFMNFKIRLVLINEQGSAEVLIGNPAGREEQVRIEAASVDLVRLFTGWFGIEQLNPASYSARHSNLLLVLFPKGDPRIGMADLI